MREAAREQIKFKYVLLRMSKSFLILLLLISSVYSFGQKSENEALSKRYTFRYESISIQQLLDTLKQDFDFTLYYSSTNLDLSQRVKVNYRDITIEELFDKLFFKTRIQFTIVKNKIVLQHFDGKLYQNVRGKIVDTDNKQPLMMANIAITSTKPQKGTYCDDEGNFIIYDVPIGRHTIQASILGYRPIRLDEVQVKSAKELVLNIEMEELVTTTEEVVITPAKESAQAMNSMATGSVRKFSMEESQRYAAGMSDPARMTQSYPGTFLGSDGLFNEVSIRGNSPKYLMWRIEGLEIQSPAHFNRAGSTGGVISMLNSSTMSNSDFYTGVFPAEYGNAVSGVFDIKLRSGNSSKREYEAKMGIMGAEFGTEGPFKKGGNATYLMNMRVSNSALLNMIGNVGANFGIPWYYDLSYKLYFPTKKMGVFTVFGLNGNGHVKYKPVKSRNEMLSEWDLYYVDFVRGTFANGIKHNYIINDHLYINTTLGNVVTVNETDVFRYNPYIDVIDANGDTSYAIQETHNAKFNRNDYRLNTFLNIKANSRNSIRLGMNLSQINYEYDYDSHYRYERIAPLRKYDAILSVPFMNDIGTTYSNQYYLQYKWKLSDDILVNAGINYFDFQLNNTSSLDPRVSIKYQMNDRLKWVAAAGRHSKHEDFSTLFIIREGQKNYLDLELVKSDHYVLGGEYKINKDWYFKAEGYYQEMTDVGVDATNNYAFSNFNMYELYSIDIHDSIVDLSSEGKARSYGLELSLEKFFSNQYYFLMNYAHTRSFFSDRLENWFPSTFDHQHIFKTAFGKDFSFGKNKQHTLGFNLRYTYAQGKRYLKLDEQLSQERQFQTYDYESGYSEIGDDISNVDFGLNYISNRKKVTHEVRLDVYNITNNLPIMGSSFDRVTNQQVLYTYHQTVPFLTYSVKW